MLYLETPPGVGFSKSEYENYTDTKMGDIHLAALRAFFDRHMWRFFFNSVRGIFYYILCFFYNIFNFLNFLTRRLDNVRN